MNLLFLLKFSLVHKFLIFVPQNGNNSRFMDEFGWTPWKIVFVSILDGLYYFVPGLLVLIVGAFLLERLKGNNQYIQIFLTLIMLGGLILAGYGAFHLVYLIANLEHILFSLIYLGIALVIIILIIYFLYKGAIRLFQFGNRRFKR